MGYANPSQQHSSNADRSLPSALKTRPKIPRTPDGIGNGYDPNWKEGFEPAPAFDIGQYLGVGAEQSALSELASQNTLAGDRQAQLHQNILGAQGGYQGDTSKNSQP
jgi:hypothetical protein